MDKGRCKEYDHPFNLLANDKKAEIINKVNSDGTEGHFAKMVKSTGKKTAQSLFNIAKEKFN